MKYIYIFLFLILSLFPSGENLYQLQDGFPIWIKDGEKRSEQTSGITFITGDSISKNFLICDDVGAIRKLKIKNNNVKLENIEFSNFVKKQLEDFQKWDFEEIVFDRSTGEIYLSIEGNGPNYKNEVGIYKVKFKHNDINSNEITSIEKINFSDWGKISRFTSQNIGFEGVGISTNRIFLGLEGFQFGDIFLDSTMLYILDKNTKRLIKEISTTSLNIHTICGLYAIDDYHILGIDRNQQSIFEIKFDKDYNIITSEISKLDLPVPGNKELKYVAAIESITLDDDNFIYVIDDPWKKFYVPPIDILKKLNIEDQKNFKSFIPLLFKYKKIER